MLKPFKKGVSGNPCGSSKKSHEQHLQKVRYQELVQALHRNDLVEKTLLQDVLQTALNSTEDELETLFKQPAMPMIGKVILRECLQDPEFALRVFMTYYDKTGTQNNNTVVINHNVVETEADKEREYNRIKALFV